MLDSLEHLKAVKDKVAGVKQVQKAVQRGQAKVVYMAADAEPHVLRSLRQLCEQQQIEVVTVPSMTELGKAAGIEVGSATVAVLKL
ncbi:MAG: L7Ae/L30e/S12e/Gadd45 family ribosomal protein [Bacillota bacterium]|jgi:large subunit ribosomal protein L7A